MNYNRDVATCSFPENERQEGFIFLMPIRTNANGFISLGVFKKPQYFEDSIIYYNLRQPVFRLGLCFSQTHMPCLKTAFSVFVLGNQVHFLDVPLWFSMFRGRYLIDPWVAIAGVSYNIFAVHNWQIP